MRRRGTVSTVVLRGGGGLFTRTGDWEMFKDWAMPKNGKCGTTTKYTVWAMPSMGLKGGLMMIYTILVYTCNDMYLMFCHASTSNLRFSVFRHDRPGDKFSCYRFIHQPNTIDNCHCCQHIRVSTRVRVGLGYIVWVLIRRERTKRRGLETDRFILCLYPQ